MTFVLTSNSHVYTPLNERGEPLENPIRRMVDGVDGHRRYALNLWKVPEGKEFRTIDLSQYPKEYIQTAGGPERFTVETRQMRPDGPVQTVWGRDEGQAPHGVPTEVVSWESFQETVFPAEVLSRDEVFTLFVAYLHGNDFSGYRGRVLTLAW